MIAKYGEAVLSKMTVFSWKVRSGCNVCARQRLIGNGNDQDAVVFGDKSVGCPKKIHILAREIEST